MTNEPEIDEHGDDMDDVEDELTHSGREVTLGFLPSTNLDAVRSMMTGHPWVWHRPSNR